MGEKLTIKDLLAKKEQLKNNEKAIVVLHVESLGGDITIQEPTRDFCIEALEMAQSGDSDRADAHIVYNCVIEPNLKDKELQEAFKCIEPTDIVDMIFKPGEVASISGNCLDLAGYGTGLKKVEQEIKN